MSETYITFNGETNALDYLERAACFIREACDNSRAWKWVVIALHGALYGFAISACKGTDYHTVTHKRKRSQILFSFAEAVAACQDPMRMSNTMLSKPLVLTDDQRKAIEQLHQSLRNPFAHYLPGDWHIEIHGMPTIAIHCIEVIRFLALETGNCIELNEDQRALVDSLATETIARLRADPLYIASSCE